MSTRRYWRWMLALLVILAIGMLAVEAKRIAALAAVWLDNGEPPVTSALLVVVSGGARERLLTALDLYRDGLAPRILLTDPYGFPDTDMKKLREAGVPRDALLAPLRPAWSTREDALSIRQIVVREQIKSLLVITSPFHCRRLRLILKRTLADLDVRVTVTASRSLYWEQRKWWADRQGRNLIPAEYLKLMVAWATVPVVAHVRSQRANIARNP